MIKKWIFKKKPTNLFIETWLVHVHVFIQFTKTHYTEQVSCQPTWIFERLVQQHEWKMLFLYACQSIHKLLYMKDIWQSIFDQGSEIKEIIYDISQNRNDTIVHKGISYCILRSIGIVRIVTKERTQVHVKFSTCFYKHVVRIV